MRLELSLFQISPVSVIWEYLGAHHFAIAHTGEIPAAVPRWGPSWAIAVAAGGFRQLIGGSDSGRISAFG